MRMINRLLLTIAAMVLMSGCPASGVTTQIIGTLVDAAGNPLSGTACFKLPVNAVDTSTNRALSPNRICFPVTNGVFPAFAKLTPNDVIQPVNTYYIATVRDSSGGLVFNANYFVPTGAGTFDIGQAIPTSVLTNNISFAGIPFLTTGNSFTGTQIFGGIVSFTGNDTIWSESSSAPVNSVGTDTCYGDSINHALKCSYNGDAFGNMVRVIAGGTTIMPTSTVNAGTCGALQTTVIAGVTTGDVISWAFSGSATGAGVLHVQQVAGSGQVSFQYCNATAGNLTPGADTINWKVLR